MVPAIKSDLASCTKDTVKHLGAISDQAIYPNCNSPSLLISRYAIPNLNDKTDFNGEKRPTRKQYLERVVARSDASNPSSFEKPSRDFLEWAGTLLGAHRIHAKLEARLLINSSGSVLENAGLNLDRYGVVPLPGSTVKGCARRAALAALREWTTSGSKPDASSPFLAATSAFNSPKEFLLVFLKVFGCTDLEWADLGGTGSGESNFNDVAWACGDQWYSLRKEVLAEMNREAVTPEETAPTRAGLVAFLPAYPRLNGAQPLELDVLTPHHSEYYSDQKKKEALDVENPVPVFFPTAAAGATYTFILVPLRQNTEVKIMESAKSWLSLGLTLLGIGGKTSAGYGWFTDVTAAIESEAREKLEKQRKEEEARREKEKKDREAAEQKRREEELSKLPPEERAVLVLEESADKDWGNFNKKLLKFKNLELKEKEAIVRLFCSRSELGLRAYRVLKENKVWNQIQAEVNGIKNRLELTLPK